MYRNTCMPNDCPSSVRPVCLLITPILKKAGIQFKMHTSIRTHSSCLLSPNLGDTHPAALYSFAVPLALRLHGPLTCFSAIFQWLSGRLLPVIRGWSYHYDGFAALWKVLYMNYICSVQHFCACAFAKGGDLANTVCQSVAISKPFSKKYPPLAQRARLLLS